MVEQINEYGDVLASIIDDYTKLLNDDIIY